MKTNIKCNFTSVFAQFNTIEEINEVANNICAQVKNAHAARMKELQDETEVVEAVVEVEVEEQEVNEPPRKNKAKSKMERAKEMAKKFKETETKVEKPKKESKPEPKTEAKSDDTLIAITDMKAIKKLGLTFEKYNDKCFVLRGNTKPLRKVLKEEFKAVFNGRLTGGEGWVVASKYAQPCAKALGLKYVA